MKPQFSVIITNYNYARYLPRAIESVLEQIDLRIEIIVVDDGSTDQSREVLEGYADRVFCIYQTNRGQAAAFNVGFEAAKGEFIVFLDADDFLAAGALAVIASLFQSGTDFVQYPLWLYRDGESENFVHSFYPSHRLGGDPLRQLLQFGYYVYPPTSGNAFTRKLLEKCFPIPEEDFRICADAYLLVVAAFHGKRQTSTVPLAFYRCHTGNAFFSEGRIGSADKAWTGVESDRKKVALIRSEAAKQGLLPVGEVDNLLYMYKRVKGARIYGLDTFRKNETSWSLFCSLGVAIFTNDFLDFRKRLSLFARCVILLLAPRGIITAFLVGKAK